MGTVPISYEIYMARAGEPGSAQGDWAQAENELRAERRQAQALSRAKDSNKVDA